MKSFCAVMKEQAEQEANQKYFNLLARNKWLPAIRMKNGRTSVKNLPIRHCKELLSLKPGKDN
jgi:hypothetical protein